jgi:hypothetical protein
VTNCHLFESLSMSLVSLISDLEQGPLFQAVAGTGVEFAISNFVAKI